MERDFIFSGFCGSIPYERPLDGSYGALQSSV